MNVRLKSLGLKIYMSVRNVRKLRINIFAHCWDKRSLIMVCVKTRQGKITRVSKIVRGLVSLGGGQDC